MWLAFWEGCQGNRSRIIRRKKQHDLHGNQFSGRYQRGNGLHNIGFNYHSRTQIKMCQKPNWGCNVIQCFNQESIKWRNQLILIKNFILIWRNCIEWQFTFCTQYHQCNVNGLLLCFLPIKNSICQIYHFSSIQNFSFSWWIYLTVKISLTDNNQET